VRIGVIQSSYIPWRGYFDFIREVDLFVFYDDLQFSKGSWRNRNQIKTPTGLKWMSVPVRHDRLSQLICETCINYSIGWQKNHLNQFTESYRKAPFFGDAANLLNEAFKLRDETISELNIRLIRLLCAYFEIATPMRSSAEFSLTGAKTERLVALLRKVGASTYLSGPSARSYIDEHLFRANGIGLEYKSYDYAPYPQLWGEFEGAVSVLDLIANMGPASRELLASRSPNIVALG
jgi:hypothetical protein